MALTLDELDQLLRHWDNQIKQITDFLAELNMQQKALQKKVELKGVTAQELDKVLGQANEIIPYFAEINKIYQSAVSLRQTIQPWGSANKIEEIIEQLTSSNLVTSGGKFSPTRLIEHLLNSLERVQTLFKNINDTISSNKTTLERSTKELSMLQQLNPGNQSENLQAFKGIKQAIDSFTLVLEQDPLGTKIQIEEQVVAPLNQLNKSIQNLMHEKTRLQEELKEGYSLLEELNQVHAQTLIVYTQSQQKGLLVAENIAKPLTPDDLDALNQWWKRLKSKLSEGWIQPVKVGLVNWTKNVQECTAREHQIWQVSRSLYEESQQKSD